MKARHFDINTSTLKRARHLRKSMTDEESLLWSDLKTYRKLGIAFRRQAPIGPFVVDFLCRKAMLVVEVEGEHHGEHSQWDHDVERDAWLRSHGYSVLRFWNADVRHELDAVTEAILAEVRRLSSLNIKKNSLPLRFEETLKGESGFVSFLPLQGEVSRAKRWAEGAAVQVNSALVPL